MTKTGLAHKISDSPVEDHVIFGERFIKAMAA